MHSCVSRTESSPTPCVKGHATKMCQTCLEYHSSSSSSSNNINTNSSSNVIIIIVHVYK